MAQPPAPAPKLLPATEAPLCSQASGAPRLFLPRGLRNVPSRPRTTVCVEADTGPCWFLLVPLCAKQWISVQALERAWLQLTTENARFYCSLLGLQVTSTGSCFLSGTTCQGFTDPAEPFLSLPLRPRQSCWSCSLAGPCRRSHRQTPKPLESCSCPPPHHEHDVKGALLHGPAAKALSEES